MLPRAFAMGLATALSVGAWAPLARADVSSWFFAGGGAGRTQSSLEAATTYGMMRLEMGLGTPPDASVIVGGMFKSITFFSRGTDLALTVRGATGGFVRGTWGFALDAGGFERWWGPTVSGFLGELVLGGPWGIQASALFEQGGGDARTYAAAIGVDLMRFSVYRTSGRNWFPNPFPPAGVGMRDPR